ncbi:hypothetical protein GPECTOR_3g444 [Gonium pectorale]|uniref:Uncharacterized protein n=1 Tax=Gonium pectorale TaxID=33097 RepID=A0A150H165_GONPE|nr:hypothetical protein GPECTOR_3g444 [Gonium pectorale]|eukprot:KXZ55310.1 hypothetical protein GPECTOR_3g444 [Gonium pectorale]
MVGFLTMQNDSIIYTASGHQQVGVWDTATAKGLALASGHEGSVKSVSALPLCEDIFATGRAVVSKGKGADTVHGILPHEVAAYACPARAAAVGVTHIAVADAGDRVTVSCLDSQHHIFSISRLSSGPLATWCTPPPACKGTWYMRSAFSPCGDYVLCGSMDSGAHIWSASDPQRPPVHLPHDHEVTGVAWCGGDWGKVATCSDSGEVRVWTLRRPPATETRTFPVCAEGAAREPLSKAAANGVGAVNAMPPATAQDPLAVVGMAAAGRRAVVPRGSKAAGTGGAESLFAGAMLSPRSNLASPRSVPSNRFASGTGEGTTSVGRRLFAAAEAAPDHPRSGPQDPQDPLAGWMADGAVPRALADGALWQRPTSSHGRSPRTSLTSMQISPRAVFEVNDGEDVGPALRHRAEHPDDLEPFEGVLSAAAGFDLYEDDGLDRHIEDDGDGAPPLYRPARPGQQVARGAAGGLEAPGALPPTIGGGTVGMFGAVVSYPADGLGGWPVEHMRDPLVASIVDDDSDWESDPYGDKENTPPTLPLGPAVPTNSAPRSGHGVPTPSIAASPQHVSAPAAHRQRAGLASPAVRSSIARRGSGGGSRLGFVPDAAALAAASVSMGGESPAPKIGTASRTGRRTESARDFYRQVEESRRDGVMSPFGFGPLHASEPAAVPSSVSRENGVSRQGPSRMAHASAGLFGEVDAAGEGLAGTAGRLCFGENDDDAEGAAARSDGDEDDNVMRSVRRLSCAFETETLGPTTLMVPCTADDEEGEGDGEEGSLNQHRHMWPLEEERTVAFPGFGFGMVERAEPSIIRGYGDAFDPDARALERNLDEVFSGVAERSAGDHRERRHSSSGQIPPHSMPLATPMDETSRCFPSQATGARVAGPVAAVSALLGSDSRDLQGLILRSALPDTFPQLQPATRAVAAAPEHQTAAQPRPPRPPLAMGVHKAKQQTLKQCWGAAVAPQPPALQQQPAHAGFMLGALADAGPSGPSRALGPNGLLSPRYLR